MNGILKGLFVAVLVFLLVYLVGAFMSASFNISEWTHNARGGVGFCGCCLGLFLGFVTAVELQDE